jgi:branched-chain amino acid transport system ATP-binding protein
MLTVEGLAKSFGGIAAINDVTLEFPDRSLSAIIGPNGAGKTTFFNLISGALVPDAGRVLLDGNDLVGLSTPQIVRRGITRAFQVASIFPSLTVDESLLVAVQSQLGRAGVLGRRFPLSACLSRTAEVMEMLGLAENAGRVCAKLSHGDQKLLDIALALVFRPKVLLLDEPTAGMGPEERWQMINKVHRLWQREKITVIFIEHDMDIVFKIAGSIRVLCYGKVLAQGTPDEIRGHPEVIAAYLGTSPASVAS